MLPNKKQFTYKEFLQIDKDSEDNLEFIDNQIYSLAAPSLIHQIIVTNLFTEFGNYLFIILISDKFLK